MSKNKRGRPKKIDSVIISDNSEHNTNNINVDDITTLQTDKVEIDPNYEYIAYIECHNNVVENLFKYISTIEKFIPNINLITSDSGIVFTSGMTQDSFINVSKLFISNFKTYKISKCNIVPIETKQLAKILRIIHESDSELSIYISENVINFDFSSEGINKYLSMDYNPNIQNISENTRQIIDRSLIGDPYAIFQVKAKTFYDIIKNTEHISTEATINFDGSITIETEKNNNLSHTINFDNNITFNEIRFLENKKLSCDIKYITKSLARYAKLYNCSSVVKIYINPKGLKLEYDFGDTNNLGVITITSIMS